MESDQLTGKQVETLCKQLTPIERYFVALKQRMEIGRFTTDDPLMVAVDQAHRGQESERLIDANGKTYTTNPNNAPARLVGS